MSKSLASGPVVHMEGLCYGYGAQDQHLILNHIHLSIAPKELVIITGPSGSGKTTLLTLMGALRSATQGSLRVLGYDLTPKVVKKHWFGKKTVSENALELRKKIGFIFQNHNLIKALTAQNNVEMALELDNLTPSQRAEQSSSMLQRLGLGEHGRSHPSQLSGGQRQRVAIARALVRRPALVLADEPTASLDFKSSLEVMACLREAAEAWGTSTIMVTHDQRLMSHADRLIVLEDGVMVRDSLKTEAS